MTLEALLPLFLLALVVFVLVVFVQRASRALTRVRAVAAFERDTTMLSSRVGSIVDQFITRMEAVRRRQLDVAELRGELAVVHGEVASAREAIDGWRTPTRFAESHAALAEDLERMARALEMIDFGVDLTVAGDRRQREMESQTAAKRGYLALRHARDAFADHVAAVSELAESSARGWRASRM
ncbi:MAG: hypothetical protein ACRDF7_09990 [Candidatus Limnocylindrales bacterium]